MNMWQMAAQVLAFVLMNTQVQDALSSPVAKALADALPDETENTVADVLEAFVGKVAQKLRDINP